MNPLTGVLTVCDRDPLKRSSQSTQLLAAPGYALAGILHKEKEANPVLEIERRPQLAVDSAEIQPDVKIVNDGSRLAVRLNYDCIPGMRVSEHYRRVLDSCDTPSAVRQRLAGKVRSALAIISSVMDRQRILHRVVEAIVRRQQIYFFGGTRRDDSIDPKDLAQELGVSEATIQLTIKEKYVECAHGIVPLKSLL